MYGYSTGLEMMFLVIWGLALLIAVVMGFVVMGIMDRKGYGKGVGFVLGFFGGLIGLVIALVLTPKQAPVAGAYYGYPQPQSHGYYAHPSQYPQPQQGYTSTY